MAGKGTRRITSHALMSRQHNLYEILGCSSQANTEQILAEYRARVINVHPDKTGQSDDEFQRLQQAKDILTDPSKRKHYDTYLSIRSEIPLGEWMSNQERLQQTFHWAAPKHPTPAISSPEIPETVVSDHDPMWTERHSSTNIDKFRNYEI